MKLKKLELELDELDIKAAIADYAINMGMAKGDMKSNVARNCQIKHKAKSKIEEDVFVYSASIIIE